MPQEHREERRRQFQRAGALRVLEEQPKSTYHCQIRDEGAEVQDEGHSPAFEAWASDFEDEENSPEEENNN